MGNANPSQDPADNDSILGMLRLVLRKFLAQTDDMLPAKVIAYDRAQNRVTLQPMIQMVTTDGQRISRAQVVSLPVLNIGGGGFVLSFPIAAGDLGWIKASDRDISLFLQGYSETSPNTGRMHTFSDGLFIPDVMTGWSIAGEDDSSAVLQSLDGTVRLSLSPSALTLTAPTVIINSPSTTCSGSLTVDGDIETTGGDVIGPGGITLLTHVHVKGGGPSTLGPSAP